MRSLLERQPVQNYNNVIVLRPEVDRGTETAMMARIAILNGEANLDDVRAAKMNELAPQLGEKAAQQLAEIIVPQPAPATEGE